MPLKSAISWNDCATSGCAATTVEVVDAATDDDASLGVSLHAGGG
jgi:hypothetical protein